jgi:hypothetical protein
MSKTPPKKFNTTGSQKQFLVIRGDKDYEKLKSSERRQIEAAKSPQKRSDPKALNVNRSKLYNNKNRSL